MIRRGQIYWLNFAKGAGSEQKGRRPGLIIQNDVGNEHSPTTIVAAITSRPRTRIYPFHVAFSASDSGLKIGGEVLCEQVQTVDQSRLEGPDGNLTEEKMREVDQALRRSLQL